MTNIHLEMLNSGQQAKLVDEETNILNQFRSIIKKIDEKEKTVEQLSSNSTNVELLKKTQTEIIQGLSKDLSEFDTLFKKIENDFMFTTESINRSESEIIDNAAGLLLNAAKNFRSSNPTLPKNFLKDYKLKLNHLMKNLNKKLNKTKNNENRFLKMIRKDIKIPKVKGWIVTKYYAYKNKKNYRNNVSQLIADIESLKEDLNQQVGGEGSANLKLDFWPKLYDYVAKIELASEGYETMRIYNLKSLQFVLKDYEEIHKKTKIILNIFKNEEGFENLNNKLNDIKAEYDKFIEFDEKRITSHDQIITQLTNFSKNVNNLLIYIQKSSDENVKKIPA